MGLICPYTGKGMKRAQGGLVLWGLLVDECLLGFTGVAMALGYGVESE